VSAISTSAWAQAVAPTAVPAGGAARSAASIPDFSGKWVHPTFQASSRRHQGLGRC
jgi:hypothetical protein